MKANYKKVIVPNLSGFFSGKPAKPSLILEAGKMLKAFYCIEPMVGAVLNSSDVENIHFYISAHHFVEEKQLVARAPPLYLLRTTM